MKTYLWNKIEILYQNIVDNINLINSKKLSINNINYLNLVNNKFLTKNVNSKNLIINKKNLSINKINYFNSINSKILTKNIINNINLINNKNITFIKNRVIKNQDIFKVSKIESKFILDNKNLFITKLIKNSIENKNIINQENIEIKNRNINSQNIFLKKSKIKNSNYFSPDIYSPEYIKISKIIEKHYNKNIVENNIDNINNMKEIEKSVIEVIMNKKEYLKRSNPNFNNLEEQKLKLNKIKKIEDSYKNNTIHTYNSIKKELSIELELITQTIVKKIEDKKSFEDTVNGIFSYLNFFSFISLSNYIEEVLRTYGKNSKYVINFV